MHRAKMLGRMKHRACYGDCTDSNPLLPHQIERSEYLSATPWKWEHQERGGYATWIRRAHRRRNRRTESREIAQIVREGIEDYYSTLEDS